MKSRKINQLKVTLIDNYPELLDNHWYTGWDSYKPKYKGRYKLNFWLLTPTRPIQLQSTLSWPPSDLARRQRWRDHQQQYEIWRKESQAIKDDITRPSPIPPLLGMPSELQKVKTKNKGLIHKWYMPPTPSLIRAQLLKDSNKDQYWNIQWLFPEQKLEFVLEKNDCDVEVWPSKEGHSVVYMKTYRHGFDLPDSYYMPQIPETFIDEEIDYEYEEFKQRIQHLYSLEDSIAEQTARELLAKHEVYAERMLAEIN